ncbi:Nif11-like leader peptide family natural product precursor [Saccharopolyspora taberi]|uniref:Nif11 domain-containing protein n=1 Tax=Saccharopolyspora taberi TaxID=60895 RepID=A0ABN3VGP5_9PSEU
MSVESCKEFLHATETRADLAQQLKATTGIREVIALAGRHGFAFGPEDLLKGSASYTPTRAPKPEPPAPSESSGFYHHEFELSELPGFEVVAEELDQLKVQPPSVDLARFDEDFREEDLRSTSMSPAAPEFRDWYEQMMRTHWRNPVRPDAPRRDFHLVNLDEHIDHPGYPRYFEAKSRVIGALEELFGSDVRFSGSMWYPPSSYRLWHTNETQPGWRMYVVDLDEPFDDPAHTSFFRYMNPDTEEIVTLRERPRIVRFFKVEQEADKLFWHCIVNPTKRHRWSFGFAVPENWAERIERVR